MFGQISLDILLLFMLYATGATTAALLVAAPGKRFADFQNMQKLFQNMQNML